jgi:hypothetical protein
MDERQRRVVRGEVPKARPLKVNVWDMVLTFSKSVINRLNRNRDELLEK